MRYKLCINISESFIGEPFKFDDLAEATILCQYLNFLRVVLKSWANLSPFTVWDSKKQEFVNVNNISETNSKSTNEGSKQEGKK